MEWRTAHSGGPSQCGTILQKSVRMKKVTKKEVDRLVLIRLLNTINRSEWDVPCFVIPKKDSNTFPDQILGLYRHLKRKRHQLLLIDDIMVSVDVHVCNDV